MNKSGLYYPELDSLRFFAFLLVLVHHSPYVKSIVIWRTLSKYGWMGVDLFFVLSGFLITGILYDTRGDRHYFRTFYIRRALRIVPAYYGFLLLYFVAAPFVLPASEAPRLPLAGLAWAASYLSN